MVMTSNFGAVGFSTMDKMTITTEENRKGLSAYEKSKLLVEKAAWQFMEGETGLEFVTINPVAIFGLAQSNHVSGSVN
ncbi:hypothetical protein C1902_04945 [Listeria ivanovii]|nr:hypothetical protein C1902_04945 [Listeria ivanovii]SNV42741.1 Uncharacterised protein [Listeria ivanovii subsp. ivanovii]SNV93273.1 Uncharacterised protein [Listeria ivanovii subsp. ivanovii]